MHKDENKIKKPCITRKLYNMAVVAGVEPTSAVLETVILPLNYTPNNKIIISNIIYFCQLFLLH